MNWNKQLSLKPLPASIERSLLPQERSVYTLPQIWLACLSAIRLFILRSLGISLLVSSCAIASTFVAMELLQSHQSLRSLILMAVLYFVLSSLGQFGVYRNSRYRIGAYHASQALLINLISQKLIRISSRAAARQSNGNLKVLITSDVQHVAEFFDNALRNLVPALIGLLLISPLLYRLTGMAGLVSVLIMMAFLPISMGLNQLSAYFQNQGQVALDSLASVLGEWVKNIRLIRYLSWDDAFGLEIGTRLRRFMSYSTAQHMMACLIFGISVSWWMVAVTGVFFVARWLERPLDLRGFFGSLWLITFLAGYFIHLPNIFRLWALASPSMRRIVQLLGEEEQRSLFVSKAEIAPLSWETPIRVIFEGVSFKYQDGKVAIQDLSIVLELKQKIAIIGEVAAGKTTFLKLLCGEFPPTSGRILIEFEDNVRRNIWEESCYEAYRKHLAWVPQGPFVACDPISTNISLTSSTDEAGLMEAAYWAELEADIRAFPRGIHEDLGEGGVNLSGGQRQRLNIARAYYANRAYLVMDDALSAVDIQTEVALMKRLESHSQGFLLVTHRTSELMRVDEVVVMKNGQFIERGKPKTLASNPLTRFSEVLRAYEKEVSYE